MATKAEQLAAIETAIAGIIAGTVQSYSIDGRTLTKLDLDTLYRHERRLRVEASRETAGLTGGRFRTARPL